MPNETPQQKLPLVPETVLKKRHDLDDMKRKRLAQVTINNKVFSKTQKGIYVKKPETILAQAKSRRNHDIRFKRVDKKGMQTRASKNAITKEKIVEEDDTTISAITFQSNSIGAKVVFCIRIRDNVSMSGRIRKALWSLRLKNLHEGVFVEYTTDNQKLLHLVEPWVLYGIPSTGMISDLITRRGHGKIGKQRIPLSDNTIIESALGEDTGIICVEDLVHELSNVGDSFQIATSFLWPFKMSAPKSKFQQKKLNNKNGQIYGDRGEEIDDFVKQML
jgi:large subunit ribosomal protein L7e